MKKIKLPLEMANGVMVRTLDELKENWDLEKVVENFVSGKLVSWLNDRYYSSIAEQVSALSGKNDDVSLQKSLCKIFDKEYTETNVASIDDIREKKKRQDYLRQFTSDERVLNNVENVAMNQEELADLLDDKEVTDIFLFNNEFHIPLGILNKNYIGVGNVTVYIGENDEFRIGNLKINFENVVFKGEHAIGMRKIGLMYRMGDGVSKDYKKALEWFKKAWNEGDIGASRSIAICFKEGYGVEKSDFEYIRWLQYGEEKGHINSIDDLAYAYRNGEHVGQDEKKAMELFRKSAELGSNYATEMVGHMYEFESGVAKDMVEAVRWYKEAANMGNGRAAWRMGLAYEEGKGIEKDLREALHWYEKACELGYSGAYSSVARFYKYGNGEISVDLGKAFNYYEKGMLAGDSLSTYMLAEMYKDGEGVECNIDKAIEFYKKAIALGDVDSYKCIASIYKFGEKGIEKNLEKALEWYERGAGAGDEFCKTQVDEIKKELSPNLTMEPGETISFGKYGGTSITWILLGKDGDGTWLISKEGLDTQPFNHGRFNGRTNLSFVEQMEANSLEGRGYVDIDWHSCTLRQWLNNEFYSQAFNEDEKKRIKPNNSGDNVTMLNVDEANQFAQANYPMRCKASEFAKGRGAKVDEDGYGSWWLTSNTKTAWAPVVDSNGKILGIGLGVADSGVLIRPAILVKL